MIGFLGPRVRPLWLGLLWSLGPACSSPIDFPGSTSATSGAVSNSTGAAGFSTGTGTGSASGGSSASSTSGGSGSDGSSGGGNPSACQPDAGLPQFGPCAETADCQCPYRCLTSDAGSQCLVGCRNKGDCPGVLQACEPDSGVCQPVASGLTCVSDGGGQEFAPCGVVLDGSVLGIGNFLPGSSGSCNCPLQCVLDGLDADQTGYLHNTNFFCEKVCTGPQDCSADEICSGGSCRATCNPSYASGPNEEYSFCVTGFDCGCPFRCVPDLNSAVCQIVGAGSNVGGAGCCEAPCQTNAECNAAIGESCNPGTGTCQVPPVCSAQTPIQQFVGAPCRSGQGLSAGEYCGCGLTCAYDPNVPGFFCEACDGGSCQSPYRDIHAGSCFNPGQNNLTLAVSTGLGGACASNSDCVCPDTCQYNPYSPGQPSCQATPSPCNSNADCLDPNETCNSAAATPWAAGGCQATPCGSAVFCAATPDLLVNARSVSASPPADSGTCLPPNTCQLGGSSHTACHAGADRAHPDQICAIGEVCSYVDPSGAGTCLPVCALYDAGCPFGSECFLPPSQVLGPAMLVQAPGTVGVCEAVAYDAGAGCYPMPDGSVLVVSFNTPLYCGPGVAGICPCPETCQQGSCGFPPPPTSVECTSDSYCPDPTTYCLLNSQAGAQSGSCAYRPSFDDPDGGPPYRFLIGTACYGGSSTWDYLSQNPSQGCRLNGLAAFNGGCNPAATRADLEHLCGAGLGCLPFPDGGGICRTLCDQEFPDCICVGTQGGTGAFFCGEVSQAGCGLDPLLTQGPYQFCTGSDECRCPLQCVPDPLFADYHSYSGRYVGVCEAPCSTNSDCPYAYQVCQSLDGGSDGGACGLDLCNLEPIPFAPPDHGTVCTVDRPYDGTCQSTASVAGIAISSVPSQTMWDLCVKGGSATLGCNPSTPRGDDSQLCVVGAVCDTSGATPTCTPACDPGASQNLNETVLPPPPYCPAGQMCGLTYAVTYNNAPPVFASEFRCLPATGASSCNPSGPATQCQDAGGACVTLYDPFAVLAFDAGLCAPCRGPGNLCFRDGDCCSSQCALDAGAANGFPSPSGACR